MKKICALVVFAVLLSATLYATDAPNPKLTDVQKREAGTKEQRKTSRTGTGDSQREIYFPAAIYGAA